MPRYCMAIPTTPPYWAGGGLPPPPKVESTKSAPLEAAPLPPPPPPPPPPLHLGPEGAHLAHDAGVLLRDAFHCVGPVEQLVECRRAEDDLDGALLTGPVEGHEPLGEIGLGAAEIALRNSQSALVDPLLGLDLVEPDLGRVIRLDRHPELGIQRVDLPDDLLSLGLLGADRGRGARDSGDAERGHQGGHENDGCSFRREDHDQGCRWGATAGPGANTKRRC